MRSGFPLQSRYPCLSLTCSTSCQPILNFWDALIQIIVLYTFLSGRHGFFKFNTVFQVIQADAALLLHSTDQVFDLEIETPAAESITFS